MMIVVTVRVNVDNFARVESDHMFAKLLEDSGGVNAWIHFREPSRLDHQSVIRQNRDTLYSMCVVDLIGGVTFTMPDAGTRYVSAMILNQDHYINSVLHESGEYRLTVEEFDTPYVLIGVRMLVDPGDPADVAEVNALQDALRVAAPSGEPFVLPDYDTDSYVETRNAILVLAKGLSGYAHAFGRRVDVEPVRHLLGAAAGWGGLPESEAYYLNVDTGLPVGSYELTVRDVPVDGFWSISVYNADGYFPADTGGRVSVNNITAVPNRDGSVTVRFGSVDNDAPNLLPIGAGWNYLVRFYRPRPEILDGSWQFPSVTSS